MNTIKQPVMFTGCKGQVSRSTGASMTYCGGDNVNAGGCRLTQADVYGHVLFTELEMRWHMLMKCHLLLMSLNLISRSFTRSWVQVVCLPHNHVVQRHSRRCINCLR